MKTFSVAQQQRAFRVLAGNSVVKFNKYSEGRTQVRLPLVRVGGKRVFAFGDVWFGPDGALKNADVHFRPFGYWSDMAVARLRHCGARMTITHCSGGRLGDPEDVRIDCVAVESDLEAVEYLSDALSLAVAWARDFEGQFLSE
jgi:hypothetical protein